MDLSREQILELLSFYDNHVVLISEDENYELELRETTYEYIPKSYFIVLNGKVLKDYSSLKRAVSFFNSTMKKYNLSAQMLLDEMQEEKL